VGDVLHCSVEVNGEAAVSILCDKRRSGDDGSVLKAINRQWLAQPSVLDVHYFDDVVPIGLGCSSFELVLCANSLDGFINF